MQKTKMQRITGRYISIGIFWLLLFFISGAKEKIVVDKGIVGTAYTVQFDGQKAMLSRDGSQAVNAVKGQKVTKPGTYFLSYQDSNNELTIEKFTLLPSTYTNDWRITKESELEEILKHALENFKARISIRFQYGRFDIEQLNEIISKQIDQVCYKYPHLTIYSYKLSTIGGTNPVAYLDFTYPTSIASLKIYDQQKDAQVVSILDSVLKNQQLDYQKEWRIYRYLIDRTKYSAVMQGGVRKVVDEPMTHTMQGTLIDQVAVCDGYAKTFMYLMNASGVPTTFVVGTADGTPHAWNIVKIQGSYYHVDVTWGDKDDDMLGSFYDYFNETDTYMAKTHKWEGNYPKCTATTYGSVNLPYLQNAYSVKTTTGWNQTLQQIKKDNKKESSIIFYQTNKNKWNQERLLQQIANTLNAGLAYRVDEKQDSLIISYKKR